MQVSKNLAKWAYAWNWAFDRNAHYHRNTNEWDNRWNYYPEQISLCPLVWRTFVVTPALILAGLGLGTLVLVGIRDNIGPIAGLVAIVAAAFSVVWGITLAAPGLGSGIRNGFAKFATKVSPAFAGIGKAVKPLCPLFDVEK